MRRPIRVVPYAVLCVLLLLWCAVAPPALAQAVQQGFPKQPIRMIVPYAAGGATDAIARLIAAKLQERLGVAVVIENRAGAGGNIGADAVAKAAPDGYTVLFNINGMAISPAIYRKLAYDADADFIRVTQIGSTSTVLVVNPEVPATTFQELVALAKAKPGVLNYGSTGVGNSLHLTVELLKRQAGIEIQMVPFTGDAPLFQSLLRGDIQIALVPTSAVKEHLEAGSLRALGISTPERSPLLPNLATISEQGLPGFTMRGWMGLFLPKGTPRGIVERYWQETRAALGTSDMKARFATLEIEPMGTSPEEFEAVFRADRERFQRIVKEAGIPLQ